MGGRDGRHGGAFWAPRVLVVCSCALLIYSFVTIDGTTTVPPKVSDDVESSRSPRLAFIVIDAFRLSFITAPDSPMKFARSSISMTSSSPATLFDAYARMPTVTLPRITAYITGTLPSFGTILTNLATEEITVDNWVSRMNTNGKSVHFFGDDTWIRLLPGQFRKSEGVTSFFVNDYTEVDNNVTRHLDEELISDEWDALVLHYLGLDHIGHSLGGTSPKINEKLEEMDGIIEKVYKELLKKPTETYLIVCGDHGMTPAGSHGGASHEETRVPVIVWSINRSTERHKTPEIKRIEQIDISATIFDLFEMTVPSDSYGISLTGFIRGDRQETLMKQRRHFQNLVRGKRLSISDDVCEDDCDLSNPFIRSAVERWMREVQEELIGSASEVPNFYLAVCVLLLAVALAISFYRRNYHWTDLSLFLFNIICFASSLIEEEHEIWYFLASTVIALRIFQNLRLILLGKENSLRRWILLAVLHRVAVGYFQSMRRRWSMDPSLLPPDVFPDTFDMEVHDLNTWFSKYPVPVIGVFMVIEIVISKNYLVVMPMISHLLRVYDKKEFDAYFLALFRISLLPLVYFHRSKSTLVVPLLFTVVPLSQIPLIFIVYQIGKLSSRFSLTSAEALILCSASFFYTGNSNSLSTLSLTSAYVGLLDYYPLLVGIQLLLNTFSGPIAFLCGRTHHEFLALQFSFRISCLIMSLFCLYFFQHHLFVWSVYSPKVVYDIALVIFFLITGIFYKL